MVKRNDNDYVPTENGGFKLWDWVSQITGDCTLDIEADIYTSWLLWLVRTDEWGKFPSVRISTQGWEKIPVSLLLHMAVFNTAGLQSQIFVGYIKQYLSTFYICNWVCSTSRVMLVAVVVVVVVPG